MQVCKQTITGNVLDGMGDNLNKQITSQSQRLFKNAMSKTQKVVMDSKKHYSLLSEQL